MTLSRYAFIVKGPGYDPAVHRASLASAQFSTTVIGVSTIEQCEAAAAKAVAAGVQLIELCGGFSRAELERVRRAIGGRIPLAGVIDDGNG
jgi:hypothetical protein